MRHTESRSLMVPGFAHAVENYSGVAPRWFDPQALPPQDLFFQRHGELLCLEVTEGNLADALKWIATVQRERSSNGASPANILVASRSRRLPWRRREWMRQQITTTGAVFYQVEPDQDPSRELKAWLDSTSPAVQASAERVY
jgi:hypothetical protein